MIELNEWQKAAFYLHIPLCHLMYPSLGTTGLWYTHWEEWGPSIKSSFFPVTCEFIDCPDLTSFILSLHSLYCFFCVSKKVVSSFFCWTKICCWILFSSAAEAFVFWETKWKKKNIWFCNINHLQMNHLGPREDKYHKKLPVVSCALVNWQYFVIMVICYIE